MKQELLIIENLSKKFGGVQALDSVCLELYAGEIYGIMGPNGSGKTVLFDIISGFIKPDSGTIIYGPNSVNLINTTPMKRFELGITRTFQYLNIFQSLTVEDNVMLGIGPLNAISSLRELYSLISRKDIYKKFQNRSITIMSEFGTRLMSRAKDISISLSYANRRRLEFARALISKPQLVLLDEPTAGMNPYETYELQDLIFKLNQKGITFIIVEHKLFFFEDLANRIIVLSQGRKIADGPLHKIRNDPMVIEAYLGGDDNVKSL